jgi:putative transposase
MGETVIVIKAYRYRLYPSRNQERLLNQTLETCRRWYNACLAERKEAWENEQRSIGKFAQLARVKSYRKENAFAGQVHSHVLQVVTADLDKAFQAFFRRVKAGEKPGYPRFRGRDRFDSFGFKQYGNGFKIDGRRLKLSGIGRVAVRWHRPVEGRIKTVRIRRQAGQWYACFACEIEAQPLPSTGQEVGVDVGIASLLTTSDGKHIENPKWYRAEQAKLRVLQRRVSRREQGSANRRKAVRALQHQHARIANRRKDFLNKTVHELVMHYDRIAIEDLQVVHMAQNRHLAKSILDAGWGYFRLQLFSKAAYAGRIAVAVNPAYTTKTCSRCGSWLAHLTLADRWVQCDCGLSLDRDENAARNLLARGQRAWGVTWPVAASVPQEAAGL